MAGKTLSYFNLTGGLNTVQTMVSINSTTNRTESPDMYNVEYYMLSGLRTMNGNIEIGNNSFQEAPETRAITFGYEYLKGNERYMIVTTAGGNVYEYNTSLDSFNKITEFGFSASKHSICGFNKGIVICANPESNPSQNTFMLYYRKDRSSEQTGISIETSGDGIVKITQYPSNNSGIDAAEYVVHKGDFIVIDDEEYEVDTVNPAYVWDEATHSYIENTDNDARDYFTIVGETLPTYSGALFFGDVAKIYNVYKNINAVSGQQDEVITIDFKPVVVQSHQGRIWVGTDEGIVYYSDLGNIHGWEGGDGSSYDGGFFKEFFEDNSSITAIGTWDKYVVIHKQQHTYLINTSNSDTTEWNVESYSEYTCDNQQGFVKANNGYFTYCRHAGGIYPMIQRTIYSAISQGAEASFKIRTVFDNLSQNRLDEIYAVYHPIKRYIMFYMPMIGYEGSGNCYIYDLQTKSWLLRRIPQLVSTAFQFNNKVYVGTRDGKVLEEFYGTTFNGAPITFSWKSPWFLWGGATNWTTTSEFRIKLSQDGTNNFYIRNYRDGGESYKERLINSKSNVSLMYDEGYLLGDKTDGYQEEHQLYVYRVDTGDEELSTYYSFDNPLTETSRMYPDLTELSKKRNSTAITLVGTIPAGAIEKITEGTESDYDKIKYNIGTIYCYKYQPTKPQYKCFRSSSNPNIKAWVLDGVTNKATVNVKKEVVNKQTAWGYYNYYSPAEFDNAGNVVVYASPEKLMQAGEYACTASNVKIVVDEDGWNGSKVAWTYYYNRGSWACLRHCLYWVNYSNPVHRQPVRNTSLDVYEQKESEVWNGKTTRSGLEKTISNYTDSVITIEGVRYNRYTAGDEGSLDNGEPVRVYSLKGDLEVNDTVFSTPELSQVYGTVSKVSGTNYTIQGNIFVPDFDNNEGSPPEYFKSSQAISFPITSDTTAGSYFTYTFPLDMDEDGVKRSTDTVWADGRDDASSLYSDLTYEETTLGNKWVTAGQLTKRFPLANQYFQTIQIEFRGEADNQGIELFGFEVDGIQLTEVPY